MSGVDYIVVERRIPAIYSELNSLIPPLERDIRGRVKIVKYLENLERIKVGGYSFRIVRFDSEEDTGNGIAYVKTVDMVKTMHVDAELWGEAKLGDPHAIYVLLHELGHVLFHAGNEKNFSKIEEGISKFPDEVKFARQCALPYSFEVSSLSLDEICRRTGLEITISSAIREGSREIFPVTYQGEGCCSCGNFTMVRNGTCLKCDTCGSMISYN